MITKKRIIGNKGEDIASSFLRKNGFTITDRNYLKKWGELDIVAHREGYLHFFEVKSMSVKSFTHLDGHKPEDNVHGLKSKRLRRIIETYLSEKGGGLEREFRVHVLCVYMNEQTRTARVKWLKNIIL